MLVAYGDTPLLEVRDLTVHHGRDQWQRIRVAAERDGRLEIASGLSGVISLGLGDPDHATPPFGSAII